MAYRNFVEVLGKERADRIIEFRNWIISERNALTAEEHEIAQGNAPADRNPMHAAAALQTLLNGFAEFEDYVVTGP